MVEESHISVNKKLKTFLDDLDDSYREIANKTGIPRRTLYDLVKEGATIKHNYLKSLCEKYDMDIEWLFGITKYRTEGKDWVGDSDTEKFYSIPYYPNAKINVGGELIPQEGKPSLQIAFRKSYIAKKLHAQPDDLIAIKVKGDSMAPTLQSDDVILIDRSRCEPRSGQIFVIRIDESINCKRIQELPGHRYKIISDNQVYESFEIDADEPNFDILGTIIWFARDLV